MMTGFSVWLQKELLEIRSTWRLWVLPILFLIFAVVSPVLAEVTPAILKSFASEEPGTVITLPDPVPADALRQWGQSLSQIVLFAVIIATAGIVSTELRTGTASLVLVKPLSRRAFVLAKALAQGIFLTALTILGTAVCAIVTQLIFGEVPLADLVRTSAIWLLLVLVFIAMMVLLSTLLASQAGAAGAGIASFFALSIAALWRPLRDYSVAGLIPAIDEAAIGQAPDILIPVMSGIVLVALLLAFAAYRLERMSIVSRVG